MIWKFFALLLILPFAFALDVDFDCPDEIYVNEEFECEVEVFEGNKEYDLKVEVDEERDSVLKIWDDGTWKSGYYYLKGFIEDEETVRLKIEEEGRYDVVLKLRKDDFRKEFDVGKLRVEEGEEEESEDDEARYEKVVFENVKEPAQVVLLSEGENSVISLGGGDEAEVEEWDYISKDAMVVDWLPYAFCIFLIGLIGLLIWERF